jgi:peroxiredoxin
MGQRALRQLQKGDAVPELQLRRLGGGHESLRELAAQGPVLLAFFKVSCPVCQLTLPFLERAHGEHRIFGVSQDNPEDTREFNREFGLTFPMLLDREEDDFPAGNAFGITHVPTIFLIGEDGRISHVIEGWNRWEMDSLGVIREGDNVPAWKAG